MSPVAAKKVQPLPWVLLANGARARLFERDPDNGALRELASFVHPAARAKGSALGRDRPGLVAKGRGETQFAPHTAAKEREHEHFARELARHVEEAALAARMPGWVLLASNPFLGRVLAALGDAARLRLTRHAAADLTTLRGPDLEKRVAELAGP
jgi:protein required for attachment to host cells